MYAVLPFLFLLACPILMFFMMRGMMGGHDHGHSHGDAGGHEKRAGLGGARYTHYPGSRPSSSDEKLSDLLERRAELEREIADREQSEPAKVRQSR
jgi:hypothetical protein